MDVLQPDEAVIYRAEPAWRALRLMIGAGVGLAFTLSALTRVLNQRGHVAVALLVLALVVSPRKPRFSGSFPPFAASVVRETLG